MKRPLVGITLAFGAGIVIASKIRIDFGILYLLASSFFLCCFFLRKEEKFFCLFLVCLVVSLAALSFKNTQTLSARHIARLTRYKDNNRYLVFGRVSSEPQIQHHQASFIFEVFAVQWGNSRYNYCGKVLARLKGRHDVAYAEELTLAGNLSRPYIFTPHNHRTYRNYLTGQGVYAVLRVKSDKGITRPDRRKSLSPKRFALLLKNKCEEIFFQYTSGLTAAVLDAMVLGEKAHIPKLVYNSMVRSGTVHILVVSGFNVGIVAGLVILVLKILRLGRKLRFVLAVFCLVFYCFLTGSSTPVVRATLMGEFFLFSALLKRESDIYNSLALAALFILAVNPRQLFDVGFQLSFASVFAIVFLYPRFSSLARPQALKARWLKAFACGGLVSFSAWIGTLGFIAYYFRIFAPVTILANIFIVPLAAFITLCGFSLVFAALIFPAGAPFFAAAAELAVTCLLKINALLIRIPGAYLYL